MREDGDADSLDLADDVNVEVAKREEIVGMGRDDEMADEEVRAAEPLDRVVERVRRFDEDVERRLDVVVGTVVPLLVLVVANRAVALLMEVVEVLERTVASGCTDEETEATRTAWLLPTAKELRDTLVEEAVAIRLTGLLRVNP